MITKKQLNKMYFNLSQKCEDCRFYIPYNIGPGECAKILKPNKKGFIKYNSCIKREKNETACAYFEPRRVRIDNNHINDSENKKIIVEIKNTYRKICLTVKQDMTISKTQFEKIQEIASKLGGFISETCTKLNNDLYRFNIQAPQIKEK